MRYFAITAVRVDELGRISAAVMDQVEQPDDDHLPWWSGNALEFPVAAIASMILTGDRVDAVFVEGGLPVFGTGVRSVTYPDGRLGIELTEETIRHTYRHDIVRRAQRA
jgi:hypothetical protein